MLLLSQTENSILYLNLLFRVVEVDRTEETTATPATEGACLSECTLWGISSNKRI